MMRYLQKLGKALMLPVACLPICGILMGLGYALAPAVMGAAGAFLAFFADRVQMLCDIGGIRLRFTPIWTDLLMELGFFMMILGAWRVG